MVKKRQNVTECAIFDMSFSFPVVLERSLVMLITVQALTSVPLLTSYGFGIDWLQEVKGKQHKERHQKDSTHQGQQHVAADEQIVNYLQEKDESDEVIPINWNKLHFHS